MPFRKKEKDIVKKTTPPNALKIWMNTFVLFILLFIGEVLYLFARGAVFDLHTVNEVLALEAFVFIGLLLALSGLAYFWDFARRKIIYRKFLGLFGFGLAAFHVAIALFFLPEQLGFGEISKHKISMAFGVVAFLILAMMAVISNRYFFSELGDKRWRFLMRLIHATFIFILIHFSALNFGDWTKWFVSLDPVLPPLSFLVALFGLGVVILRSSLWLSTRK